MPHGEARLRSLAATRRAASLALRSRGRRFGSVDNSRRFTRRMCGCQNPPPRHETTFYRRLKKHPNGVIGLKLGNPPAALGELRPIRLQTCVSLGAVWRRFSPKWTCLLSKHAIVPIDQRFVMERAGFGRAKLPAFRSAWSAATYLVELSMVGASYVGLAESALLLPAINPAATPLWPPTGLALALVLLRGYRIWPAILAGPVSPYLMAGQSPLEGGSVGICTLLAAFAGHG
jgi:hypothetical protein